MATARIALSEYWSILNVLLMACDGVGDDDGKIVGCCAGVAVGVGVNVGVGVGAGVLEGRGVGVEATVDGLGT